MNNTYTVYCHESPNGKRYVGITKTDVYKRWKNGKGYTANPYFQHAIDKYKWDNFKHYILFENLTKEQACDKEKELIELWDLTNRNNGYNLDNGGISNGCHSNDTKQKISKSVSGKNNPNYGKTVSKETREKISHSLKYNGNSNKGVPFTQEHKDKIAKSLSKKLCQYNLSGDFIKEYNSTMEVERLLGFKHQCVGRVCNGKRKSVYGYIWKWTEDIEF